METEPQINHHELPVWSKVFGLVFILGLLIAILAALWQWQTYITPAPSPEPVTLARPDRTQNKEPESQTAFAYEDTMRAVSSSDSLAAIGADLDGTNLDTLTSEFNAIEAELDILTR